MNEWEASGKGGTHQDAGNQAGDQDQSLAFGVQHQILAAADQSRRQATGQQD